jgi:azobenzene reductase
MNDFVVVSGSHRSGGASHELACTFTRLLKATLPECSAEVIPINDIPFWDEGMWGDENLAAKWEDWRRIAERLKRADGLVIIAPEYAGMVPPKLSNFLLLCSGEEIGHKPALAVGVSSSRGGTYPITQLRSFGSKNNRLCWIPDHVIVRDLEDPAMSGLSDESSFIRRYVIHCCRLLDQYASALKAIRSSGVVDYGEFPYGM